MIDTHAHIYLEQFQKDLEEVINRSRESGVDHVFIFPTHTRTGGYDMPQSEVDGFRDVIFPGLAG